LPPIPDQTIVEGMTLVVTNLLSYTGASPNSVTFSLPTNAPAGAVINPTNGLFTWTPTEAQGPSTNVIIICAMDSTPPGSSATQTFTVYVLETNSAPILAPIGDRTIHAGSTLVISNYASDSDIPANKLRFSLDPGAMASASIDPATGHLTISTSDADANTTNLITVRVTDDGSPNLSDAKSFTLVIVTRPEITSISVSNDIASINWSAIPGQTYRVQYLDSLSATNWTELPPDVTAASSTALQTDNVGNSPQRFYRIALVP